MKIKLYARLIIEGAITLEDVPQKYRMAVENLVEEMQQTFDNQ